MDQADLAYMIARSDKKRHELRDGRIRALYGHSTPHRLLEESVEPPQALYHGTSPKVVEQIKREGLKPMVRQYAHLSIDKVTAEQVGRRRAKTPAVSRVRANAAYLSGISFYRGNELVWIADAVPSTFIEGAD